MLTWRRDKSLPKEIKLEVDGKNYNAFTQEQFRKWMTDFIDHTIQEEKKTEMIPPLKFTSKKSLNSKTQFRGSMQFEYYEGIEKDMKGFLEMETERKVTAFGMP